MNDWWAESDEEVLACLKRDGETSPSAAGRRLGISEAAAASLLSYKPF